MALATFDHALFGRPVLGNYSVRRNEQFRRLQVMDGPARYRLTQPAASHIIPVTWTMHDERMFDFRLWWQDVLQDGSDWFEIELMLGTGRDENRPQAGTTWRTYRAHFMAHFEAQIIGYNWWSVSATLEVTGGRLVAPTPAPPAAGPPAPKDAKPKRAQVT